MNSIFVYFHDKEYPWHHPYRYTTKTIKACTNDAYYHVSFRIDQDYYESTYFGGFKKTLTRRTDIANTYIIWLQDEMAEKIKQEWDALVGSKYDLLGVLFGFFGTKIHNPKAYFCSELFGSVLKHAFQIDQNSLKTNLSQKDIRMLCIGIKTKYESCNKCKAR